ncbi:uncharacterized protein Z518_10439 [Rhinocladiella mackenziei CBS 650.93]|uniref:Carboxylic ester hydrolase n=1 Tax=Rhinocladiella mackenziei CBS 650.93 TaxID=1442369 RepID=A0A0D2IU90_9EURO|nr:uncharacterized protein Z518_10439 [Rhinocladiella mackenziei CBS 650.93]KIX00300.1 hypothetical protein Z518_10439 [Rhinocladiella mackenziei CBS 650.93]
MISLLRLWVPAVVFLIIGNAIPAFAATPTATIDSGAVVGVATSVTGATVTVNKYLGIPFAASPRRFAPPVKPTPWRSPYHATKYRPACIQQFNYPEAQRNATIAWYNTPPPPAGESEDCLNLNVYVPQTPTRNKTVMAWIYGGNLNFGSNSVSIYDGTSFAAEQDIIIVSFNYRTNVFGFPNSPELPFAKRNLGFLDQRLALDWIQRNIKAFGGDPKKVTIFGESAGAASVDILVTTHPYHPPFRAAIMESGQTSFYINPTNVPASWLALAAALNCTETHPTSNLTCLRSHPASVIQSTIEHLALSFRPVSDNVTLLRYPELARLNKSIASVPVLTGTNANEGTVFTVGQTDSASFLNELFPNQTAYVQDILAAYPLTPAAVQLAAIFTDLAFQCPAGILANDSRTAGLPTWRYYFNATFTNTQIYPGAGAYHGSEISLVFGTYPRVNATEQQHALSRYMQNAWAAFARDPADGPGWEGVPRVGVLGNPGMLKTAFNAGTLDAKCSLFRPYYETIGSAVPHSGGD